MWNTSYTSNLQVPSTKINQSCLGCVVKSNSGGLQSASHNFLYIWSGWRCCRVPVDRALHWIEHHVRWTLSTHDNLTAVHLKVETKQGVQDLYLLVKA